MDLPAPGRQAGRVLELAPLLRGVRRLGFGLVIGLFAFAIFGPLVNLLLWAVAEQWYFPYKLPLEYGFSFWERVFRPRGNAMESLGNSLAIALFTVALCLLVSIPAGYALARRSLPLRGLILLAFLLPQAFPSLAVYINVARIFYGLGLNGTITGVVLVHTMHGLVFSVWIATAAFAAVDRELEEAARSIGASPLRTFMTITLPLAAPGIMASAIFVFLEFARRVHRHLFRRRAGRDHAAALAVSGEHGGQLPDRLDHGADPARAFGRLHAVHRALPQGRRAGQGRQLTERGRRGSVSSRWGVQ